jgi:uncharacterized protein (TIGR02466 family)|tara:strand:+ start:1258 stop:1836 length:579 start_codon:yes stop_codon:yes gene_type:complete
MAMHTELWFPSVIWSSIIHMVDNSAVKNWAYEHKKSDPGRTISNYNGYQSSDLRKWNCPGIDSLIETLNEEAAICAKQVGLAPVELYNIWLNINPPGAYNHLHNHVGSVFSGVYYVDATPEQGNIQFERSDGAEYHIPEKIEKDTYYTSTRASYAAKTGGLYIFPGWLKHSVQGNKSNADRISISFNYGEKQ